MLAGLGNGTVIATRIGVATPDSLLPAIIACDGTPGDVPALIDLLAMTDEQAAVLGEEGRRYIDTALPRDWRHVVALYERALGHASDLG